MPAYDLILTAVKAGLTLADPTAGVVITAISEYIPTAFDQANQRAADRLGARLRELEDRIDETVVRRSEFADLFSNTYATIQRSRYDEKIDAAVNILTNACLRDDDPHRLTFTELDHFSRCTELLSIGAIRMIHKLAAEADSRKTDTRGIPLTVLCKYFDERGNLDSDLGLGLLRELESYNIATIEQASVQFDGQRMATGLLTSLGWRYHDFVLTAGKSPTTVTD